MKLIVESEEEHVRLATGISLICKDIRNSNLDDVAQTSIEVFLCNVRDSIEVKKEEKLCAKI